MESKFHYTSHGFNKIQRHLYHKHIIGMMYIVHQTNFLIENIKFMFFYEKNRPQSSGCTRQNFST